MEQIEQEVKPKRSRKKVVAVSANSEDGSTTVETQELSTEKNKEQFEEAKAAIQDPQKALEAYLNDPVVDRNLLSWAEAFEKQFGKKWFTVKEAIKNRRVEAPAVRQIMSLLILKGRAHSRDYGVAGSEITKFQLTPNLQDKITLLQEEVAILDRKKEAILTQITNYMKTSLSVDTVTGG